MNLTIFNQLDFLPALREFFKALQVPIASVTDAPIAARDILESNYKDNESFRLIDEVYLLGMVDDGAFRGGKSLDVSQIKSDYDGIVVFGVTLNSREGGLLPTRSQLAEISRAFNREFCYTPVVVVFKYAGADGEYLAFANTERTKYKRNQEGEKAGKVTLLRDIDINNTHSGHKKILADLKIPNAGKDRVDSFAKLYAYWQKVLDVSLLNKQFYKEVSTWYFHACKQVIFPKDAKPDNQESLIRLITRLMFVWFLKEKGLVPDALFDKEDIQSILKSLEPQESTYYKAILQNLFFATLNTEVKPKEGNQPEIKRQFIKRSGSLSHQHMVHNVFRYERYFQEPDQVIEKYFDEIPFLNGGLFECLDVPASEDKSKPAIRIDGFSDNAKNPLSVPNQLFFGALQDVDLNADFGTSRKKYQVRGLIEIFKSYKFTIAENTPFEEDVALDPELLGQVFENLLAAYNPETQTTARKQTGSFYTPREIVNYMVDESLIAYLKNALPSPPAPLPRGEGSETLSERERSNTLTPPAPLPRGEGSETLSERERSNILTPPSPQGEGGRGDEGDRLAGKLRLIPKALLIRAKELRQRQTTAEQVLWECLRDRRLCDAKFRRQHNIDRFIADFYCHSAKLVIELDGSVHNSQVEQDQERDAWMRSQGLIVLRFRNQEIFDNLEGVLLRIVEFLPSPPAPLPRGEGSKALSAREESRTLTPTSPQGEGGRGDEGKLRHLLSYTDEPHQFTDSEVERLIQALDNCKILDPACGSGAFPMGVLQKMVHILAKLDHKNLKWQELQRQKVQEETNQVFYIADKDERQKRLIEINEAFDEKMNDPNYGRKLFLIENCIYGVDIQPIALQIAKLRCFIALIVEQAVDRDKKNSGILPLPNLETKFVAANSLIRFSDQMNLRSPAVEVLEKELKEVRQKHFTARSKATKDKYRLRDRELRDAIGDLLKGTGLEVALADSLARWNPYNQNTSADFFDPEWMFGIADSFDIVIGNPPYGGALKKKEVEYFKQTYTLKTSETAILFIEKGKTLLKSGGLLAYIVPKSYSFASNYAKTRDFTINELMLTVDCGKAFESVLLEAMVFLLQKDSKEKNYNSILFDGERFQVISNIEKSLAKDFGFILNGINAKEISIGLKMKKSGIFLNDIATNSRGEAFQKFIDEDGGDYAVIGGAEINQYGIRGIKGYIDECYIESEKGYINTNSILAQNIVAHIKNPTDHIKIIACIPDDTDYLIADTINQIYIKNRSYSKEFIWAILKSNVVNWFTYYFIFGKAIRTMHFDSPITSRIPIPTANEAEQKAIEILVGYVLHLTAALKDIPSSGKEFMASADDQLMLSYFEQIIDATVMELYLPEELHAGDKYFMRHLLQENLPNIDKIKGDKMTELRVIFRRLFDRDHPIRTNIYFLGNLDIVKIIRGKA